MVCRLMNQKLEKIRGLLSQIEEVFGEEQRRQFSKNYNALELPSVMAL